MMFSFAGLVGIRMVLQPPPDPLSRLVSANSREHGSNKPAMESFCLNLALALYLEQLTSTPQPHAAFRRPALKGVGIAVARKQTFTLGRLRTPNPNPQAPNLEPQAHGMAVAPPIRPALKSVHATMLSIVEFRM